MAYTSEQYKYLLFRRLRRHLAMTTDADRAYTQSFFSELFDETVTVTEEAYNNFVDLMDTEIQFCADQDIYSDDEITDEMVNEHGLLLVEAFASIGIGLTIAEARDDSGNTLGGDATFTKPNGDVMVYSVRGGLYASNKNRFYIYSRSRTEYQYTKLSAPYYNFVDGIVPGLNEHNPRSAGPGCYWSYDANTKTLTVTGDGAYVGVAADTQIGSGPYEVVIIGANVSALRAGCFAQNAAHTIVALQPTDAPVETSDALFSGGKDITAVRIYCDNLDIRAQENASVYRFIEWHSLDEWDGGATTPAPVGRYYNGEYLPAFIDGYDTKIYAIIGETSDGVYMATVSATERKGTLNADTGNVSIKLGNAGIFGIGGEEVWTYDSKSDQWYWDCLGMTSKAVSRIVWANYNVPDADGNIVFEASEPTLTP